MDNNIENRDIRVFISSTFRDMQPERDELVSKTFPMLRALAAKRHVTLTDIDLRWGISKEESEANAVLEICLEEIDNSHPFFIGLLGGRYGWTPDAQTMTEAGAIPERYSWVSDDLSNGLSITEIEMQYGALRNNDKIYGYFFIKEMPDSDIEPKQKALRDAISLQDTYPVDTYATVEELSEKVTEAFVQLLDTLYPIEEVDTEEQRIEREKSALRGMLEFYEPSVNNDATYNSFIESTKGLMIVEGNSGMGKTTFLASKATETPADTVIYFPALEDGESYNTEDMAQSITRQLEMLGAKPIDPNIKATAQISDIISQYAKIKAETETDDESTHCVIFIDDADKLKADTGNAWDWIKNLPKGVKVVVAIEERNAAVSPLFDVPYHSLVIGRMNIDSRIRLAQRYFKKYRKHLSTQQESLIASANPVMDNTLVFVAMLDEMRRYGDFDNLSDFISSLSESGSTAEFFNKILDRQEALYAGTNCDGIVGDVLSLIAVSKSGLSESEILGILNGLPQLYLSEILASNRLLIRRHEGRLSIANDIFAQVIKDRYYDYPHPDDEYPEDSYRLAIADYFLDVLNENTDNDEEINIRAYEELPYQYYKVEDLDSLYLIISRLDTFGYYERTSKLNELANYWRFLAKHNPYEYDIMAYAYALLNGFTSEDVSTGLIDKGLEMMLREALLDKAVGVLTKVAIMLINYLNVPEYVNSITGTLFKLVENADSDLKSNVANTVGIVQKTQGNYAEALDSYMKAINPEKTSMASPDVCNIGELCLSVYEITHDEYLLDTAIEILREVVIAREADPETSDNLLAVAYANYASAITHRDPEAGMMYSQKSIDMYAHTSQESVDMAIEYHNLATHCLNTGNVTGALASAKKSLDILAKINGEYSTDTLNAHVTLGYIYMMNDEYDKAVTELRTAVTNAVEVPSYPDDDWIEMCDYYVGALFTLQEYEEAVEISRQMIDRLEAISSRSGTTDDRTIKAHADLGKLYLKLDRGEEAIAEYKKAIDTAELLMMYDRQIENMLYLASALSDLYRHDDAIDIFDAILDAAQRHEINDKETLAYALFNRGVLYCNKGEYEKSTQSIRMAIAKRREIFGEDDDMARQYEDVLHQIEPALEGAQPSTKGPDGREYLDVIDEFETISGLDSDDELYLKFAEAYGEFNRGMITSALSGFELAYRRSESYEGINGSTKAIILQYLAFSEEIQSKDKSGDKAAEFQNRSMRHYNEAYMYAVNDKNIDLALRISHDGAEACWAFEAYDGAYVFYLKEFCSFIKLRSMATREFARLMNNIVVVHDKIKHPLDANTRLMYYFLGLHMISEYLATDGNDVLDDSIAKNLFDNISYIADLIASDDPDRLAHLADKYDLNYCIEGIVQSLLMGDEDFRPCTDSTLTGLALVEMAEDMAEDGNESIDTDYFALMKVMAYNNLDFFSLTKSNIEDLLEKAERGEYNTDYVNILSTILARVYMKVFNFGEAYEVCERYGIDTGLFSQINPMECTLMHSDDAEQAADMAKDIMAKEVETLTGANMFDLAVYLHSVGQKYESRRYADLWWDYVNRNYPHELEMFIPAKEYLDEVLS